MSLTLTLVRALMLCALTLGLSITAIRSAAHALPKKSGCGVDLGAYQQEVCQSPTLRALAFEILVAQRASKAIATPKIARLLDKSQRSWERYWPEVSLIVDAVDDDTEDNQRLIKKINLTYIEERFQERLKLLRSHKQLSSDLMAFKIGVYHAKAGLLGDATHSEIVYEQLMPLNRSARLKRLTRFFNQRLKPSKADLASLKDPKVDFFLERTFLAHLDRLWGIKLKFSVWCPGCNGADSKHQEHQWFLKKNLKPLRVQDLFQGQDWKSIVTTAILKARGKLFGPEHKIKFDPSASKELFNLKNWTFDDRGLLVGTQLAYYVFEWAVVPWEELEQAGVKVTRP